MTKHKIMIDGVTYIPVGVIDGKFIVYVPPYEQKFPKEMDE